MASDPFPPHSDPVDLEGSTAMASLLFPVTAQSTAPIFQHADLSSFAGAQAAGETGTSKADALAEAAASLEALRLQAQQMAGQGLNDAEAKASRSQDSAAQGLKAIESPYVLASHAMVAFNSKFADLMRTNIESTVDFWASMMATRSLSEAVALNARHIRKQMEALTLQGKELSSMAQAFAAQSAQPMRQALFSPFEPR